ncbi:MAG: hypothetical protein ACLQGP_04610 [Isosphaeraceae bacterium]
MFGILPTRVHGFLDYVIGLSLVLMSFILANGAGPQTWLPVVLGGGMIVYSLLTEYEMGVVPLIGMPYHLILDVLGGMLLAGSPWMLGFAYIVWLPHVVLGLAAAGAAVITQTQATRRTFAADFGASP